MMASNAAPSALSGVPDWGETHKFIRDVVTLASSDGEEVAALAAIRKAKEELAAIGAGRESDAKAIVAALQKKLAETDAASATVMPKLEALQAAQAEIAAKSARLKADVEGMEKARNLSSDTLHSLTSQMASLKRASQTLLADHSAAVPRVRHSLSLYANITAIRWDYDSPLVSGYIVPGNKGAVSTFSFDQTKHSDKAVADMLWAAIGEAHTSGAATATA